LGQRDTGDWVNSGFFAQVIECKVPKRYLQRITSADLGGKAIFRSPQKPERLGQNGASSEHGLVFGKAVSESFLPMFWKQLNTSALRIVWR